MKKRQGRLFCNEIRGTHVFFERLNNPKKSEGKKWSKKRVAEGTYEWLSAGTEGRIQPI